MKQIRHNQRGSALLLVLFAVVLIGLTAGLAGRTWSSVMQQVREDELLFRGDQYRRAIESYYQSPWRDAGKLPHQAGGSAQRSPHLVAPAASTPALP